MPKKFSQKLLSTRSNVFSGDTKSIQMNFGTISATTSPVKIVGVIPKNATITGINVLVGTTITANDTNYWTFAVTNVGAAGAGTTAILAASDANTTKATGGTGITALDTTALTLNGTAANLAVNAGDAITFTATKAASAANLVEATIQINYKDR